MQHYAIVLFYSTEDKCYVADIPDLKYCSAFGETAEEALKEVQITRKLWLKSARKHNKPIPKATFRPPFLEELAKMQEKPPKP